MKGALYYFILDPSAIFLWYLTEWNWIESRKSYLDGFRAQFHLYLINLISRKHISSIICMFFLRKALSIISYHYTHPNQYHQQRQSQLRNSHEDSSPSTSVPTSCFSINNKQSSSKLKDSINWREAKYICWWVGNRLGEMKSLVFWVLPS